MGCLSGCQYLRCWFSLPITSPQSSPLVMDINFPMYNTNDTIVPDAYPMDYRPHHFFVHRPPSYQSDCWPTRALTHHPRYLIQFDRSYSAVSSLHTPKAVSIDLSGQLREFFFFFASLRDTNIIFSATYQSMYLVVTLSAIRYLSLKKVGHCHPSIYLARSSLFFSPYK